MAYNFSSQDIVSPVRHDILIRQEIYSAERFKKFGEELAASHEISKTRSRCRRLRYRLLQNAQILKNAYDDILQALDSKYDLPPAAEWLIDNYFIIEEQTREIRNELLPSFCLQLPILADGTLTACPRIYSMAVAYIGHTDSFFNPSLLSAFIEGYQCRQPLNIGELWAIGVSLRMVLIENLRRTADLIIVDRKARSAADRVAERLLEEGDQKSDMMEGMLRRIDREPIHPAFAVQLIQRLRDQKASIYPVLERLNLALRRQGTSSEEIVRLEHQNQGALTITVRNIITSMRSLTSFNWVDFFEEASSVDQLLRADSGFGDMDLPTRNLYRRSIEGLAKRSSKSEIDVARLALQLTSDQADNERMRDPGYYLIDEGLAQIRQIIGYRTSWRDMLLEASPSFNFAAYIGANMILATILINLGLAETTAGKRPVILLFMLALAAFFPAWEAASTLVNRLAMFLFPPAMLPALSLASGISTKYASFVVVPVLFSSTEEAKEQIGHLAVHYLANEDNNLNFALLSDWKDATVEQAPHDMELLSAAKQSIEELNVLYPRANGAPRFFLFHRRRLWNKSQGVWMGWERKRGKLNEFNRLLRGADDTSFILDDNQALPPENIRFVITLDADTRLPRGTIRRLIGKMAHPLNRPIHDPLTSYITKGYGILQPRVSSSLPSDATKSLFQKTFYRASGIDPYTFSISDIYQDVFAEGSFTGKGIYDVDAFETATKDRIPENTVLSHDLIEGIFARAGLVSDIEVIEEYPSHYDTASSRHHRWARGDWQLLPWIFGKRSSNISALSHWKMVDNLRRTLTAPFALLALVLGWMFQGRPALIWTLVIVLTLCAPLILELAEGLLPHRGTSKRNHFFHVAHDIKRIARQIAFIISFLPHQAWLMLDAMLRTWWRLSLSHSNMLEWVTAAESAIKKRNTLKAFYVYMSGGIGLTLAAIVGLAAVPTSKWLIASPFLLLWLAAPAIAEWSSRCVKAGPDKKLSEDQRSDMRLIARATWRFFDHFVTAEENFLPPDNFQEDPEPVIAHRTSPTNIGLYLLTIISAEGFGWLAPLEALARLGNTLATIGRMEHFRGHLYNWYETTTLKPLPPRYISSVDSGNLAGYYIGVAQYLKSFAQIPVLNCNWAAGVNDMAKLICQQIDGLSQADDNHALRHLKEKLREFLNKLSRVKQSGSLMQSWEEINEIASLAASIRNLIDAYSLDGNKQSIDLTQLGHELSASVNTHNECLKQVCSWLPLLISSKLDVYPEIAAVLKSPVPVLENIPALCNEIRRILGEKIDLTLAAALEKAAFVVHETLTQSRGLETQVMQFFYDMDFKFLLDPARKLLSIGYRVEDQALDPSFYDLLASEARLASIVAIAKNDIPVQNWFRLGRTVTPIEGHPALVSWSGSMFEYLMPTLVMNEPTDSLIGVTNSMIVRRQIDYGRERGIPWGISESAYNGRDFNFTYQYSSFGVPGLGLKRGLSENIVVAPYATVLASMVDPQAAFANLKKIAAQGGYGTYGYYEAIDFTKKRLQPEESSAVVRAYMAHHQGMSIVALFNVLEQNAMKNLFHANYLIQATELLLQELPPRDVVVAHPRSEEVKSVEHIRKIPAPSPRCFSTANTEIPRTHLLSNGDYHLMITAAGSGYSQWRDRSVTRWHEDTTRDHWGSYIYLRDITSGDQWSAGYQPLCKESSDYNVAFFEDKAEFSRRDGSISTIMNVVTAAEDDGEVRRISLHNHGDEPRDVELTSYAELVLTHQANDTAHPAFSKMFIQTEYLPKSGALLASRRPRTTEEAPIHAVHLISVGGDLIGNLQYETDRSRFLGRNRDVGNPQAIDGRPLSDTVGTVLDPIFSLRCRVRVLPGQTVHIAFWTLMASSRSQALELAEKYRAPSSYHRAAERAWTHAQLQYQHQGLTPDEAHLFQRLANNIIYDDPALQAKTGSLQNAGSQSALWAAGISGDLPIALLRLDVASDLKTLRQLVRAHNYWTSKGLAVDLVILNEQPASYLESLQGEIEHLIRNSQVSSRKGAPNGRIIILRGDQLEPSTRNVLLSSARLVLVGHRGSLVEHLAASQRDKIVSGPVKRINPQATHNITQTEALDFFNGIGGFAPNGNEYVIVLEPGHYTPAPWVNVIANSNFGFQVSADGSGYSWAANSREFKLTPWSNDPVSDASGEVIYLRDFDTGVVWSPTAHPIRDRHSTYTTRHGFGYSQFHNCSNNIETVLTQHVPLDRSVKISRLTLKNKSNHTRRLSVTAYIEWVLSASRNSASPILKASLDIETGAMLVSNPWNNDFGKHVAFVCLVNGAHSFTNDRGEFVGRNGSLRNPTALTRSMPLEGTLDFSRDACTAMQNIISLRPGEETNIFILLGSTDDEQSARALIRETSKIDFDQDLQNVKNYWQDFLGKIQVQTPDPSFDIMQNGWLMYQTVVCRIWARSGFYQSSGAYGYRDQLQDVMAVASIQPDWTRRHLLRAAGRQFPEGDVQHWWLPSETNAGRGVRTRFADDPLWLAYVAAHYMKVTGDQTVLEEQVSFLNGPLLKEEEHENYFMPEISKETASFYDHCVLAVERSLTKGPHGLSLFNGGDWNDGMNRVGIKGQGESVWMSWFLLKVISDFIPVVESRDPERASRWKNHSKELREALEEHAWDGEWYRRGFYDSGEPLGSAISDECKIDSIAQSWSVISDAADPERQKRAMKAAEHYLIRTDESVAQLFTPPFDHTSNDPGYIKGYPPGLRENGGQYTHAALWSVVAFALLGKTDKAYELFSMLNPINHATSRAAVHRYKVEPYSVAADIYANHQHIGRGGWTWYTGSSGWMYRVGLETILGFDLRGNFLHINPRIPLAWQKCSIVYRHHSAVYKIDIDCTNGAGRTVQRIEVDGKELENVSGGIPLENEVEHSVKVILG